MKIGSYAKAIVAAAAAGTAAAATAIGDSVIAPGEWVTIALAVLGALGITAVVPNAQRSDPQSAPKPRPTGDSAPDSGWPRLQ